VKKREWSLLAGLCGVFVVVLIAGEVRAKHDQQEQYQAYTKYNGGQNETTLQTTSVSRQSTPLGDMDTVDFLSAIAKQSGVPTLVIVGSSASKGIGISDSTQTWYSLLIGNLRKKPDLAKLKAYNLSSYAATTSSLLSGKTLTQAIKQNPNVILLETCAVTDWYQGIPEKTSLSNLKLIVNRLQTALPDSRIVLYSPNPISSTPNSQGLTYNAYLTGEEKEIQSQGWDFIDVHSQMEDAVNQGTYQLSQLLTQQFYPNEEGDKLWEQAVLKGLQNVNQNKSQGQG
jgi:hypothetical protein